LSVVVNKSEAKKDFLAAVEAVLEKHFTTHPLFESVSHIFLLCKYNPFLLDSTVNSYCCIDVVTVIALTLSLALHTNWD